MALSKSSYGSVGVCRLYVDYLQYCKAIGYIDSYELNNLQGDEKSAWDYNPANMQTYTVNTDSQHIGWLINFKNGNRQFSNFLGTINYFGVLGHDIGNSSADSIKIQLGEHSEQEGVSLVGDVSSVGYTLKELQDSNNYNGSDNLSSLYIYLKDEQRFAVNDEINVGSLVVGRYFDFPHSANLSMNVKRNYEGITTKNTISGRSISNINYYKQPHWGNYPAWTNIESSEASDDTDFRPVSQGGRREWDLTWSFLSKEDTFPKTSEDTMAGIYDTSNGAFDGFDGSVHQGNIMGWLTTFSMGGNIPMILQVDKTKQEFAKVKINQKSISIQQSAPSLYTCKLKLTEVW